MLYAEALAALCESLVGIKWGQYLQLLNSYLFLSVLFVVLVLEANFVNSKGAHYKMMERILILSA